MTKKLIPIAVVLALLGGFAITKAWAAREARPVTVIIPPPVAVPVTSH